MLQAACPFVAKVTLDAETFKALASPTRLQVLRTLGERRKTLTEMARDLNLNKATIHEHLALLLAAGLVKKRDDEGRKWIYYELTWRGEKILHPQETTTFSLLLGLSVASAGGGIAMLGRALGWWLQGRADPISNEGLGVGVRISNATSDSPEDSASPWASSATEPADSAEPGMATTSSTSTESSATTSDTTTASTTTTAQTTTGTQSATTTTTTSTTTAPSTTTTAPSTTSSPPSAGGAPAPSSSSSPTATQTESPPQQFVSPQNSPALDTEMVDSDYALRQSGAVSQTGEPIDTDVDGLGDDGWLGIFLLIGAILFATLAVMLRRKNQ